MDVPHLKSPGHRSDVDGLRAIAVLAVIVCHFNSNLLPSGFVGVDIFFVISGFVVTSSLLRMETTQFFPNLMEFWRRRCLRILPPLIVMVAISMIVFALFFPPVPTNTYNATFQTGSLSLIGASNLYLIRIMNDYFQNDQSINLFLHTWSLGVEEQFYFFGAIILLAIPAFSTDRPRMSLRIPVIACLSTLSLIFFLLYANTQSGCVYYGLPTRFWELGVGCLIALNRTELARSNALAAIQSPLQVIAVALILVAVTINQRGETIFTWPIIFAVAGSALLIMTGEKQQGFASRLLATAPMVWIGILSYSLYLWHWPILVAFRYTVGLSDIAPILAAFALMFVISILSYRFVETPWRRANLRLLPGIAPRYASALILVVVTAVALEKYPGTMFLGAQQIPSEWAPERHHSYTGDGRVTSMLCTLDSGSQIPDHVPPACRSNVDGTQAQKNTPTLFLVGDSHSFALWGMAGYAKKSGAFNVSALNHDGCNPFGKWKSKSASCRTYLENLPALIRREMGVGDIVLTSFFVPYRKAHINFSHADRLINKLIAAAKGANARLIIEAPPPQFERPAYACTQDWFRLNSKGCHIKFKKFKADRRPVMEWLAAHSTKSNGTMVVFDSAPHLCKTGVCRAVDGTRPIFRDQNHLSERGATSLGPHFLRFVSKVSRATSPAPGKDEIKLGRKS